MDEFDLSVSLRCAAPQARAQVRIVRRFLWHAGVGDVSTLTKTHVERYLASLAGRAAKTRLNHRSAIRNFCRFLLDRRPAMLGENPCAGVLLARPESRLPVYLDPTEARQALQIAEAHGFWPEVCLALSTGLRLSELIHLRWADVHLEGRYLLVQKSKSKRPRSVPLSRAAIGALQAQASKSQRLTYVFPARRTWRGGWRYVDRPRASNWWQRTIRPIQEAIPKFRMSEGVSRGWHLFRHTFASRAAQAGVSLYKIARWLGHTDVRTTEIYAHLRPGFDEEIEAATPLAPGPLFGLPDLPTDQAGQNPDPPVRRGRSEPS